MIFMELSEMSWEGRIKRYLHAFGYQLLGFEGGLIFWKDETGRVWGSREEAVTKSMKEWEIAE
jgi:hypothetical protein